MAIPVHMNQRVVAYVASVAAAAAIGYLANTHKPDYSNREEAMKYYSALPEETKYRLAQDVMAAMPRKGALEQITDAVRERLNEPGPQERKSVLEMLRGYLE